MSFHDRLAAISARAARSVRLPAASDDRRWALRKSSILAAVIISDRLQGTVACVVRDLSATGAKIGLDLGRSSVIGSPSALPPTFKMRLDREQIEVDCQLQWTTEREAGVRFLGAMRHLPAKPKRAVGGKKT
jgi:hypothetical protein